MSDDERLARALQAQFDAEERERLAQEAASERLAQQLAARSHSMSDSDDDEPAGAERPAPPRESRAPASTSPRYSLSEDSDNSGGGLSRANNSAASGAQACAANGHRSGGVGVTDRGVRRGASSAPPQARAGDSPRYSVSDDSGDGGDEAPAGRSRPAAAGGLGPGPAAGCRTPQADSAVARDSAESAGLRRSLSGSAAGRESDRREPADGSGGHSEGGPWGKTVVSAGAGANGSNEPRRACRYGLRCYRQDNPTHTAEFSHPEPPGQPGTAGDAGKGDSAEARGPPAKRRRVDQKTTVSERLREAEPISFFLTKVRSVKSTWRERLSLGIVELLDPSLGELRSSLQLNFMVDLDWLLEAYSVYGHEQKPLTVLHGIDPFSSPKSHITIQKVNMPYPFGTHHTKMMLFEYTEGLRVVIHTSNLVDDDWRDKTQGLWVSPLLPPLKETAAGDGESPTGFRADLTRYLAAYKLDCLAPWLERLEKHDFSAIRVFFVGSVPGRYQGSSMQHWGHFRVRRLLQKYVKRTNWELVIQCSSIGRLGTIPEQWLLGEFRESLTGGPSSARAAVLYPTEENVRTSVEGYDGGSCLPYHHKTHVQQLWLREFLHQWKSESRNRSGAMPHIKTYTQLSADRSRMAWFLLTSANLSKAAWGATEKQGQQLFIRSYEAGVLFTPKMLGCEFLSVQEGDVPAPHGLSLPYSLPLTPYGDADKPWFADTGHARPDAMGRTLVRT